MAFVPAYNKETPPPGITPSAIAARVAFKASSIRSFISLTSTSEVPPTLITPTEPFKSEILSFKLFLANLES